MKSVDAVPFEKKKPLWLYPNLLSVDAPLVALAWLYLFSQTWRLYIPWDAYAVLGLGVWVIYSVDRLVDCFLRRTSHVALEPRHLYHIHHWKKFAFGIVVALVAILGLVVFRVPVSIFRMVIPGCLLVLAFFGTSFSAGDNERRSARLKNLIAGVAFAFGTMLMANLYRQDSSLLTMVFSPEFLCFSLLCIMNISAIDVWEAVGLSDEEADAKNGWLNFMLLSSALATVLLTVFEGGDVNQMVGHSGRPFYYAIMSAFGLLYFLNWTRNRYSADAMRVFADVALIVAVLVYEVAARQS